MVCGFRVQKEGKVSRTCEGRVGQGWVGYGRGVALHTVTRKTTDVQCFVFYGVQYCTAQKFWSLGCCMLVRTRSTLLCKYHTLQYISASAAGAAASPVGKIM